MHSEIETYLHRIEDLRGQVGRLIANLSSTALNWRPLENTDDHSTNSLAVLATHIAGAEHFWIAEVIGGRPPTRNRDAEFTVQATAPAELQALLNKTGTETREIFSSLQPSDLATTRNVQGRTVSVRWGILHVIDHTALHLGHMQLTYQLWHRGKTGYSPRWFQRLPSETSH